MILVDSLLLLPVRGVLWCAREIQRAAREQRQADAEALHEQLRELYMLLETGRLSEAEFTAREAQLLESLETGDGGSRHALPGG